MISLSEKHLRRCRTEKSAETIGRKRENKTVARQISLSAPSDELAQAVLKKENIEMGGRSSEKTENRPLSFENS